MVAFLTTNTTLTYHDILELDVDTLPFLQKEIMKNIAIKNKVQLLMIHSDKPQELMNTFDKMLGNSEESKRPKMTFEKDKMTAWATAYKLQQENAKTKGV